MTATTERVKVPHEAPQPQDARLLTTAMAAAHQQALAHQPSEETVATTEELHAQQAVVQTHTETVPPYLQLRQAAL